jgi:hypothetical protein
MALATVLGEYREKCESTPDSSVIDPNMSEKIKAYRESMCDLDSASKATIREDISSHP